MKGVYKGGVIEGTDDVLVVDKTRVPLTGFPLNTAFYPV